jgi:hypothetical protein
VSNWQIANAVVSLFAAAVLTVVILHPRIHEGLGIKAGLMVVVVSLLATAGLTLAQSVNWEAYWRAGFTMRAGMALVCLGILYRARVAAKASPPPYDAQAAMTRSWMRRITEPVNDLAHLFADEPAKRNDRERAQ